MAGVGSLLSRLPSLKLRVDAATHATSGEESDEGLKEPPSRGSGRLGLEGDEARDFRTVFCPDPPDLPSPLDLNDEMPASGFACAEREDSLRKACSEESKCGPGTTTAAAPKATDATADASGNKLVSTASMAVPGGRGLSTEVQQTAAQ
jgi:hypothetical protein